MSLQSAQTLPTNKKMKKKSHIFQALAKVTHKANKTKQNQTKQKE